MSERSVAQSMESILFYTGVCNEGVEHEVSNEMNVVSKVDVMVWLQPLHMS
jgi:hypothetical protein